MNPVPYRLNYSQDDVRLQGVLLPIRNADNLVFTLDFQEGFDPGVMRQALRLLFGRNDCLRLRFVHKGLSVRQFFSPEATFPPIPELRFDTVEAEEAYLRRFQDSSLDLFRGETLQTVFAAHPDGSAFLLFKTSHYVADLYGIQVLVADLTAVYRALRAGEALPPSPASFEAVLRKDNAYYDDPANRKRDRAFYRDYFSKRHPQRPCYCGLSGGDDRRWRRLKRLGFFYMPFDILQLQTRQYNRSIPAATFAKLKTFCDGSGSSLSTVLYFSCALTASTLHGRAPRLAAMKFVDCRATIQERKSGGTKVQGLASYLDIDYDKSLTDNLTQLRQDLDALYRHHHYSVLKVDLGLHWRWCYPPPGYVYSFCYSYIAQDFPADVSFRLFPGEKSAMHAYIMAWHDRTRDTLTLQFDVRKNMADAEQVQAFGDRLIYLLDRVLPSPDKALRDVL